MVIFLTYMLMVKCDALSSITVIFDSSNALHRDINYHPEQPERIAATIKELSVFSRSGRTAWNTLELVDVAPENISDVLVECPDDDNNDADVIINEPLSETELQHARSILMKTHKSDIVTRLEESCNSAKELRVKEGKKSLGHMGNLDPDTYLTTESYAVCLRATASWIRAVDLAAKNGRPTMALTRPPGHHATRDLSNGFCIFNFAAATAVHVLQRDPNHRVSILDWDVHYGW